MSITKQKVVQPMALSTKTLDLLNGLLTDLNYELPTQEQVASMSEQQAALDIAQLRQEKDAMILENQQQAFASLLTTSPTSIGIGGFNSSNAIQIALTQGLRKSFNQTPLAPVKAPPPDSSFIEKKSLEGVTFVVLSVEVGLAPTNYNSSGTKKQAVYTILIPSRIDLGPRKIGITSRFGVAQAMNAAPSVFPFSATLGLDDPSRGQYAGWILAQPWQRAKVYIHTPEVAVSDNEANADVYEGVK